MQYGDGLFETCVAKDNKVLFWDNHFSRLNNGCDRLNIKKIANSVWLEDIKKHSAYLQKKIVLLN
jgi:4-amino-4-deoxychorismate lyase